MLGRDVVIVAAVRTPIGSYLGTMSAMSGPALGAIAIKDAVTRAAIEPTGVDEVVMGNVLQAGEGQAPARQAAINAGLSAAVPCWTLNKVCGSGLKAIISGAQAIAMGDADVVVAGGMESMSNVPHYLSGLRSGIRLGDGALVDGMVLDGLTDAFDRVHMGACADGCAQRHGISRDDQDTYALESMRRAAEAQARGDFREEIVPVEVSGPKGEAMIVDEDEGPRIARPEKVRGLRPAFREDGTVTAANSSSLNDGAAAVVLMSREQADREHRAVLARIVATGGVARTPVEFTDAPADAVRLTLDRAGLAIADIDLWEINEAFAVVAIANCRLLGLELDRVNVRGGAVALGHPIGASGARILVTLLHTLRDHDKKRGAVSLCIGGGEAIAAIVERP